MEATEATTAAAPLPYSAHAIPGKIYVTLGYVGSVIILLVGIAIGIPQGLPGGAVIVGIAAFLAVVQFLISRGVARFRWDAWWVAAVCAALSLLNAVLGAIGEATPAGRIGNSVAAALCTVFLHYFWTRRADFGIKL
ncbi:MAG TPA: hypothetical protein VFE05_02965 [Longimicrobiaceae bacterium]|jgi:hypothetical protein|nr:hypothetical protein [Longimicrobiaceae bacterium]